MENRISKGKKDKKKMPKKIDKTFEGLFLKKSDLVLPKEEWSKLIKVLENHKDEIEIIKKRLFGIEMSIKKLKK